MEKLYLRKILIIKKKLISKLIKVAETYFPNKVSGALQIFILEKYNFNNNYSNKNKYNNNYYLINKKY